MIIITKSKLYLIILYPKSTYQRAGDSKGLRKRHMPSVKCIGGGCLLNAAILSSKVRRGITDFFYGVSNGALIKGINGCTYVHIQKMMNNCRVWR